MKARTLSSASVLVLAATLSACARRAAVPSSGQDECPNFELADPETLPNPRFARESVTNQAGSHRAEILCEPLAEDPEVCHDRVLVEEMAVGSIKELRTDCFLSWRPFSSLKWAASTVLEFDQWATPEYGHHFEVDVEAGQLLEVHAITVGNAASPGG